MGGVDGELHESVRNKTVREWQVVRQASTVIIYEDVILHATEATPQLIVVGGLVDAEVYEQIKLADHQLGGSVMCIDAEHHDWYAIISKLLPQPLQSDSMTPTVRETCRE